MVGGWDDDDGWLVDGDGWFFSSFSSSPSLLVSWVGMVDLMGRSKMVDDGWDWCLSSDLSYLSSYYMIWWDGRLWDR